MILLFLAAQAAGVRPAAAQPYRPAPATIVAEPVALLFAGFDRDGDARVTRAEMQAGIAAATADGAWAAGLGYLAFADWSQRWLGDRNGVPTPFEIDRDGDNRVTRAELGDRLEALFARYDADQDGAISRAEMLTIRGAPLGERRRDRRGRESGDDGPPRRR